MYINYPTTCQLTITLPRRSSDLHLCTTTPESSCGIVPSVKEVPLQSCVLAFPPYNTVVYTYEGPMQEGEGFRPFLIRFCAPSFPVGPAASTPLDFLPEWSFHATFAFV